MNAQYVVKPQADLDLDQHADYLFHEANFKTGLRFLAAAHDTFALLSTQPNMGWRARLKHPSLKTLRVFRVAGYERMLILYQPLAEGVDILRVVHGSRNLQALFRRRGEIEL